MGDKGRRSIGQLRQVSVRIDPVLHDEACRRAAKEKLSVSQVCRRAIRIGLCTMLRGASSKMKRT
jgi:predicted HicB family RNase H-like nuclease